MRSWTVVRVLSILTITFSVSVAQAAPKANKNNGILKPASNEIFSVELDGKTMACALDPKKAAFVPGILNAKKGTVKTLSKVIKDLKALVKATSGTKQTKAKKKLSANKKLVKSFNGLCAAGPQTIDPTPTPEATPEPTPDPAQLFAPHTAVLTYDDVVYLFQKVAYAPTTADLQACIGQTAQWCFDNRLNVFNDTAHSALVVQAEDYLDNNPAMGSFPVTGQINLTGLQKALSLIERDSPNQYVTKLALHFLHNHFAFVYSTLGNQMEWQRAAWTIFHKYFNYARTGDIRATVNGMIYDPVLMRFLDNDNNKKSHPGENFPREVWELYTIGKNDPRTGLDRYTNTEDIPQFSRAFTGWRGQFFLDPSTNRNEVTMTFVLGDHSEGPKPIWQGRPEAAVISTIQDAINVSIAHEGFGEYWALDVLKTYLTLNPSADDIEALAMVVRESMNLHQVIRTVVTSERAFSTDRKAAVKDSLEKIMTYVRTMQNFGFPASIDNLQLAQVNGQQEFANSAQGPFGSFGFSKSPLYSSSGLLKGMVDEWQRLADDDTLFGTTGFTFSNVIANLTPSQQADRATVINHIASVFGCSLQPSEVSNLVEYMGFLATGFDANGDPTGYTVSSWDPSNALKVRTKIPGVIKYIFASNCYGTK